MAKKNEMIIPIASIRTTEYLSIADRNAKGAGTLENSLAVFYKVKHAITIQVIDPTPR